MLRPEGIPMRILGQIWLRQNFLLETALCSSGALRLLLEVKSVCFFCVCVFFFQQKVMKTSAEDGTNECTLSTNSPVFAAEPPRGDEKAMRWGEKLWENKRMQRLVCHARLAVGLQSSYMFILASFFSEFPPTATLLLQPVYGNIFTVNMSILVCKVGGANKVAH